MQVRSRQGDTLDQLCWRHLRSTRGSVEATLQANPHLNALGPVLPQGTAVNLMDTEQTNTRTAETVKLWD
ncbi:MAG: tail protein X [Hydrogenophaga sp.]|uniref:tail protein X n=1 Tax=Hydrogenophaga sp. TaxID=1904254 RepID=UPI002727706B|nr:tail protein X [Hydrogenophaga sp.]MDO9571189.1 tail protein X [Hydrogenophaga sp.]MDP3375951.1 tail protein X [Hydrogenophaga sp.]